MCSPLPDRTADFNPRPPCGRRRKSWARNASTASISTHVPRAGDDLVQAFSLVRIPYFNPRPPCGRRLFPCVTLAAAVPFQPTSPVRETTWGMGEIVRIENLFQPTSPVRETTDEKSGGPLCHYNFNPRPPCGRRLVISSGPFSPAIFQPTSPVRETTGPDPVHDALCAISTHVPRAGDDSNFV